MSLALLLQYHWRSIFYVWRRLIEGYRTNMSNLFTGLLPIFVLLTLAQAGSAYADGRCSMLFNHAIGTEKDYPRIKSASPPRFDFRDFIVNENDLKMQYEDSDAESHYLNKFSGYKYVFSIGPYKSPDYGSERRHLFDVFQNLEGGPLIRIRIFPDFSGQDQNEARSTYLRQVEAGIIQKKIDPELDAYYSQMSTYMKTQTRRGWFWSKELPNNGNIEIYPVGYQKNYLNETLYAYKHTVDKGSFYLETLDTVKKENQRDEFEPTESVLRQAQNIQESWVNEIMEIIGHEYRNRRNWSPEFIESIREKAIRTMNRTKYIVIREKINGSEKGKIIATIGINKAFYGSAKFFNSKSNSWETSYGPFGPLFVRENLILKENYASTEVWDKPIPMLNLEEYLGVSVNRPTTVIETIFRGDRSSVNLDFTKNDEFFSAKNESIFLGMGIVYEPVRLYVAKDAPARGVAYEQLLLEFYKEVFNTGLTNGEALTKGQFFYTYNTREGVALYKKQGFKVLNDGNPITKDGHEWYLLGASSHDLLEKAGSGNKKANDKDSREFIEQLSHAINGF